MRLMIPRAVVCTATERPPLVIPNVYYGSQLIGVGIRLAGRRYLSIQWARPTVPDTHDSGKIEP